MVRFRSVEVLSLYTTMVLKRLVTAVQPVEMPLKIAREQLAVVSSSGASLMLSGSDR
ncbi:hypothetical protein E2C01_075443 [Portunus trituberculatus]|uniref:Uncharacterized protein n=1 Tax=Portunus trituberculatus TaxID=210409 RepID=A0A5B7I8K4_PORTR|nr:hypothetical protein [Portunus trituberculatus]